MIVMANLEQLQAEAQTLTRAERDQLMATLAYENRNGNTVELSSEEEFILDTIFATTQVRISRARFLESYGPKKFRTKTEELLAFIEMPSSQFNRHDIRNMIAKCLRSLADEMQGRNMPLTPQGMLNNISLLPTAVDRGFPGYVEAGFLHRIIG